MTRKVLWMVLVAAAVAVPAEAQQFGIRAGVSGDPDQFFFGGHYETRPLFDRVTFRPNVEVGVGDDITLVALNFEFAYSIPLDGPWRLYLGGGPAANIYSNGDTEVDGGFNIMIGAQHSRGFFTEFKVGMGGSPDVKFAVGYAFR